MATIRERVAYDIAGNRYIVTYDTICESVWLCYRGVMPAVSRRAAFRKSCVKKLLRGVKERGLPVSECIAPRAHDRRPKNMFGYLNERAEVVS